MITMFTLAANDQSVVFLSQIFGSVGVLPAGGTDTVVSQLFSTLNTTALVLGAILVVHTTVIGLLKTASEGEFLGKQWSSLWTPLRMVIGIASLVPSVGGYSILQVAMMWFIMQGIGAADTLWGQAIKVLNISGSPYAGTSTPTGLLSQQLPLLFQAMMCQSTATQTSPSQYTDSSGNTSYYFYCAGHPTDSFCSSSNKADITTAPSSGGKINYPIGPGGSCGTLQYDDPSQCTPGTDAASQIKCAAVKGQQTALQSIVKTFGAMSDVLAGDDSDYIKFYENTSPPNTGTAKPADWIQAYCTSKSIPATNCCMFNSSTHVLTTCYTPSSHNIPFAADKYTLSGASTLDPYNTSADAITKAYWPFGVISGAQVNFINDAVTAYTMGIQKAVTDVINKQPSPASSEWQQGATDTGWIMAGSYYYLLAKMNGNNLSAANPQFVIAPPSDGSAGGAGAPMSGYRNNNMAASALISMINGSATASSVPQMSGANTALAQGTGGVYSLLINYLQGSTNISSFNVNFSNPVSGSPSNPLTHGGIPPVAGMGVSSPVSFSSSGSFGGNVNPLVNLTSFGQQLIQLGIDTFLGVVIATTVVVIAAVVGSTTALGTGDPGAHALGTFVSNIVFMAAMAFVGFCFTFGGMLSVYTPLIPYMIFTFAAIGWFTAVIEAMVATPFMALGILAPGGQSEMLGHAGHSIMMVLNLFLRPTLMVMGMMFSMLLAPVVVLMINEGFGQVVGLISPGSDSIVTPVLFVIAYAFLIIGALNKCFDLIHWLPNHVLTWIGGHATSYGEEGALGAVKSGFEGGAAAAGGAASAAAGAGKGAIGAATGAKKEGMAAAKAAKEKEEREEREAAAGADVSGKKK